MPTAAEDYETTTVARISFLLESAFEAVAEINLRNGEGKTPLQLAQEDGLEYMTEIFVELDVTE